MAVNCMTLSEENITTILEKVLEEFPIYEMDIYMPKWVERLSGEDEIKRTIYDEIRKNMDSITTVKSVPGFIDSVAQSVGVSQVRLRQKDMGKGTVSVDIDVPRELFYSTLGDISGFSVKDDGDFVTLLGELSQIKSKYDKVAQALEDVEATGYGIVMPTGDELTLQEPEIVKRAGKYSVKLKASAPSIHMIRANIETEVSPAVGGEKSSGDMISFLLQEFEGDTAKIWESNIFGKSLHDIAGDNLQAKIRKMPTETQVKLRDTLQRIINDGAGGLICIIL
jgi:stage IV sporulation protein A